MPIVRITLPAEKRALREKMRALGLGHREIATEFARRYRLRPRAAWREAHGWSLREAAAQINAYTGTVGLDPAAYQHDRHGASSQMDSGPAKPLGRRCLRRAEQHRAGRPLRPAGLVAVRWRTTVAVRWAIAGVPAW